MNTIDEFDSLTELALDMHSSWNHSTDEVWRKLRRPCRPNGRCKNPVAEMNKTKLL